MTEEEPKPKELSTMAQLAELGRTWSRGKRIFNTYFEIPPLIEDPDRIKRFKLREEPKPVPEKDKDLFDFIITESNIDDLAKKSQELTVESFIDSELSKIEKKIKRLEKRKSKQDPGNIDEKIAMHEKRLEDMKNRSDNYWIAKTKKEAQGLWFNAIIGLGSYFLELDNERKALLNG